MRKHQPKITQFFRGGLGAMLTAPGVPVVMSASLQAQQSDIQEVLSDSSSDDDDDERHVLPLPFVRATSLLPVAKETSVPINETPVPVSRQQSSTLRDVFTLHESKQRKRARLAKEKNRRHRAQGSMFKTLLNRQLVQDGNTHLLDRWTLAYRIVRRPHTVWMDGQNEDDFVNHPAGLVQPKTTTCLAFESTGQILACANDKNEISFFDFNEYRKLARKQDLAQDMFDTWESRADIVNPILEDEGIQPALAFKVSKPAGTLLWDPMNEDLLGASFEEKREICMYNVKVECTGDVFLPSQRTVTRGNSTFAYIPDRHIVVAGTVEGTLCAWDTRNRRREIWVYQSPRPSTVTAILSMDMKDRVLVSFASGALIELDLAAGVKRSQAFTVIESPHVKHQTLLQKTLQKCRGTDSPIGIHTMVRDKQHPSRVALLATNGAVVSLETRSWRIQSYENQYLMGGGRLEDKGYHPNYRNCAAFSTGGDKNSFLFNVRKSDETVVDVFDFDFSTDRGMSATIPDQTGAFAVNPEDVPQVQSGEVARQWGSSTSGMGVRPHPLQMDLGKKISAITIHPDADMLVVAHYRDPRIRVFGVV